MRFQWLFENPDTLYLDTDTWCVKPMAFSDNCGHMNIEALWNGKDSKIFKDIYNQADHKRHLYILKRKLDNSDSLKLYDYFEHSPRVTDNNRGF